VRHVLHQSVCLLDLFGQLLLNFQHAFVHFLTARWRVKVFRLR
jgi:hypothetical protein